MNSMMFSICRQFMGVSDLSRTCWVPSWFLNFVKLCKLSAKWTSCLFFVWEILVVLWSNNFPFMGPNRQVSRIRVQQYEDLIYPELLTHVSASPWKNWWSPGSCRSFKWTIVVPWWGMSNPRNNNRDIHPGVVLNITGKLVITSAIFILLLLLFFFFWLNLLLFFI